jgi:energy-coupling factor transporter transmembrane protein EcfT
MEWMLQVAYYSLESGADGVLGSSDYTSTITDTDGNSYSFYFSAEANKVLFEASPTSYLPKVVCDLLWYWFLWIMIMIMIMIALLIFTSVLTHTNTIHTLLSVRRFLCLGNCRRELVD